MDSPPLQPVPLTPPASLPPAVPVSALGERVTQSGLALLLVIFVGLLAYQGYELRVRTRPTEVAEATVPRLDLNAAPRDELELLPGVGPRLANAIDDHRKTRGPFRTVHDLRGVPGVGPATVDKLRPFFSVAPTAVPQEPEAPLVLARKPPPAAPAFQPGVAKIAAGEARINLNTATAEQLLRLPAVGPTLAQRIVEHRKTSPFERVEDLAKVRGIGKGKTFEKIRPFVVVE